ncbi:Aminomethyltransferase folate-binding domain-containing protein [Jhaorihella thermophila]|uniref:Aminomethyltransferase folate-binding domain-containing protein n=1 Tax=Jhaorihella thermophila TaxID=488547 RepID=A0A1H5SE62_9RHOB|nr:Aminomethyltransferase folate-binding domain-containing protein [Jhaorihella thermophila]
MAGHCHQRLFGAVPLPEGTTFESLTEAVCGFNVDGPKSRAMLQRSTNASLETADFPFMASRRIDLAGVEAMALRVSFAGIWGGNCVAPRPIGRGFTRRCSPRASTTSPARSGPGRARR